MQAAGCKNQNKKQKASEICFCHHCTFKMKSDKEMKRVVIVHFSTVCLPPQELCKSAIALEMSRSPPQI